MSTEQIREQFEKWWEAEQYDEQLKNYQGLLSRRIKANMFLAYAASREALVLYFPEPFQLANSHSGIAYYYASEVDKAICAAGITVKEG